jgi:hypothetical protein
VTQIRPRDAIGIAMVLSMGACLTPSPTGQAHGVTAAAPSVTAREGTAAVPSVAAEEGAAAVRWAGPDAGSETMVFLLMGQSNMEGAPKPEARDLIENGRVVVLAYDNCPGLGRTYDEWYVARPPLHNCHGGVGPGDYFGKALADAYPTATIGLVPVAINGADIDMFRKGVVSARRREFRIPPDDHWAGAYEWILERARMAARAGRIRGIIFHQGESDTGRAEWVGKVAGLVADLRADLGLGDAPFVAGELLYSGCCGKWHNPLILQLPSQITSSRVVSADALSGIDAAHFDLAGQRELGARYGAAMVDLLRGRSSP